MSTKIRPRPWYCLESAVDDYQTVLRNGGDLRMLKALKILRSILVIATIGAIGLYALYRGGNPTIIALVVLPPLAAYAGVEAADYAALMQAYQEVKNQSGGDDE